MTEQQIFSPAQVPEFLESAIPGFAASEEYRRLDEDSRAVPGLLVGQLGILLRRVQSDVISVGHTVQSARLLQDIYDAIERLSASPSPEVQNLVVVELLEHLHGGDVLRDTILSQAGSATRGLYRIWVEPNLGKF